MPLNTKLLKKLRDDRHWSMEDAGIRIDASRQYWSRLEAGQIENLSIKTLEKVAKALGVPPGDLLTGGQ